MAKQFFQKNTNSASKKCWKKIVSKSAKTRFLYSHEYRGQKMGEKKARNNFSKKTRTLPAKNVVKKSSQKVRIHVFYIHMNIVNKKWGEKSAKQFFQKNTNSASKKCWDKKSS